MYVKQLSVFIENTEGRLAQVTKVLADNNINIISFSLADTSDFGLLRMIVSDPEKGVSILKQNGFSAKLADVLAIRISNGVGAMQKLLSLLGEASLNVEYMYILSTSSDSASVIIKATPLERAYQTLVAGKYELYQPEDAYRLQT